MDTMPRNAPANPIYDDPRWRRARTYILQHDRTCHQPGADTVDHITELQDGADPYDTDNLAPAHRSCNSRKGSRNRHRTKARASKTLAAAPRSFDQQVTADIKHAALAARGLAAPMLGPVAVRLAFTFARPAKHHVAQRRDRPLRDDAPRLVAITPDIDKVTRAVLDALTDAGWWHDDAQVAMMDVRKVYGEEPGVHAQAWEV